MSRDHKIIITIIKYQSIGWNNKNTYVVDYFTFTISLSLN